jgi:hypothetical protein
MNHECATLSSCHTHRPVSARDGALPSRHCSRHECSLRHEAVEKRVAELPEGIVGVESVLCWRTYLRHGRPFKDWSGHHSRGDSQSRQPGLVARRGTGWRLIPRDQAFRQAVHRRNWKPVLLAGDRIDPTEDARDDRPDQWLFEGGHRVATGGNTTSTVAAPTMSFPITSTTDVLSTARDFWTPSSRSG